MSKIRLHGTSSGYTEIAPVAASGNNTLTLPNDGTCLLYTSPSPRDRQKSRMPSSA